MALFKKKDDKVKKEDIVETNEELDVQTTFNTDGLDILNEDGEVENQDADEVTEGIGAAAVNFTMRTGKPGKGNKSYIRQKTGGWNSCIQGNPTDVNCNVLANCVGYANGRFNEVITEIIGYQGNKYNTLNCNAENFIERAKSAGLEIGTVPKEGAIICWMKGSTLSGSDGAGHVAFVEKVYDNNHIYTSESGYGSSAFWNQHRYNNNGRWGIGSGYTFRGFIYNPYVKEIANITPNVEKDIYKNQIEVLVTDLRVRDGAGTSKSILGLANKGYYNFYETKDADGYKWYRIADGQWIASNTGWTNVYTAQERPKLNLKYKVGDVCTFTGVLYEKANGEGAGQRRENLKATITLTHDEYGTLKPYNINNGLGWVAEEDLKPYVEPTPTPTPSTELKEGDTVVIKGTGNADSYGTGGKAYGIGWTRTILKVWTGRKFPYQVGNSKGTTGFYQASALEKK